MVRVGRFTIDLNNAYITGLDTNEDKLVKNRKPVSASMWEY
jgi:hypothetical protein